MRVVVIGATGNVGSAVLRRLRQQPEIDIVGVARRRPDDGVAPYDGVVWHSVDIGYPGARDRLTRAMEGADAVIHLGWVLQPNREEPALRRTNIAGTRNVLAAALAAGVSQVVVASSVGAYSPGPKSRRVDESWPTGGIHTSHYSRHKAVLERILDRFEQDNPAVVVSRLRPGLIFQRAAGQEITRYFLGRLIPANALGLLRAVVLPLPPRLVTQAVHADDVAEAFWLVLDQRAAGAFNIAAEPALDAAALAEGFGARGSIPVPYRLLRGLAWLTWRAHLQPTDPGWVDIAIYTPLMSTERARRELGWSAHHTSVEALAEVVEGMRAGAAREGSPPMRPNA